MNVTLTYDPATGRTLVDDQSDARGPVDCYEPDGILGMCRAGSLYASNGRDVAIRVRRAPAGGDR